MVAEESTFLWIGTGCYPGLKPFSFGTVVAPDKETARKLLEEAFAECLPVTPPIFDVQKGRLVVECGAYNPD